LSSTDAAVMITRLTRAEWIPIGASLVPTDGHAHAILPPFIVRDIRTGFR
jgi:hypothetical protein